MANAENQGLAEEAGRISREILADAADNKTSSPQIANRILRQIRHFLYNWYLAIEIKRTQRDDPGVRNLAKEGAEDLWDRLQKKIVLSMMSNPGATVGRDMSTSSSQIAQNRLSFL